MTDIPNNSKIDSINTIHKNINKEMIGKQIKD